MQFTLREMLLATIIVALALALWLRGPSAATIAPTQSPMDLAIVGRGYVVVQQQDTGDHFYTRFGRFIVNANQQLEWSHEGSGYLFEPAISIPSNSTRIDITRDGLVQVFQSGNEHNFTLVGQMQLAIFNSDSDVEPYVGQLLVAKPNYSPQHFNPGENGAGWLQQGWSEDRGSDFHLSFSTLLILGGIAVMIGLQIYTLRRGETLPPAASPAAPTP